ncbi:unnamed protein product [Brassica rapa subsp. trilocularis]|uniref:(rape) hypothetical protein n=1 Tax=Brassica napus TaxID=3708 RepID=A0A816QX75_BRANA|nr:unnamed protein product [Brassica napus]
MLYGQILKTIVVLSLGKTLIKTFNKLNSIAFTSNYRKFSTILVSTCPFKM